MGNSADRTGEKRNTPPKDFGNKELENRSKTEATGRNHNGEKIRKSRDNRRRRK